MKFEDRVALVTGAARGIGKGIASHLLAEGATTVVVDLVQDDVDRACGELAESAGAGDRVAGFACDISKPDAVEALFGQVKERFERLDILVNNAGITRDGLFRRMKFEQWQQVIDVNVKSLVLCCKHVGRVMLEQNKGKIINISSVRGFQGRARDLAYAPSKGAVNQLTHSLAIEWGPKGINVNAIAPTFTRTVLAEEFLSDPANSAWVLSRIPMGRIGELDDLFGPVVFLASDASNMVNGHVLPVDGGWLGA